MTESEEQKLSAARLEAFFGDFEEKPKVSTIEEETKTNSDENLNIMNRERRNDSPPNTLNGQQAEAGQGGLTIVRPTFLLTFCRKKKMIYV